MTDTPRGDREQVSEELEAMRPSDRRLIEDYLPIAAISEEARIENSVTQARGYLSKALLSILHRWWARRPLVACRAAVYSALVPLDRFRPDNGPEAKRDSLARANAAKYLERLCQRTVTPTELSAAAADIREAHEGRVPRVLDQFAGGGSIPLEAARLGCETYALELNPVAHLVELATLVYPARFGADLVREVKRWAEVVRRRGEEEVGDLYQLLARTTHIEEAEPVQQRLAAEGFEGEVVQQRLPTDRPTNRLVPIAYFWTRTVPCKHCGGRVPLHRQTWLRKKAGGFVALRPVPDHDLRQVKYELLEASAKDAGAAVSSWGFDPSDLSTGGETECPFCQSAVKTRDVKDSGMARTMGIALMGVAAVRQGGRGKVYIAAGSAELQLDDAMVRHRLKELLEETGGMEDVPLPPRGALGFRIQPYGFEKWDEVFTDRQLLALWTFVKHVRQAHRAMLDEGMDKELARAVATYIAFIIGKVAERGANVCRWHSGGEKIEGPIANGKMPMVWDFPEANPFGGASGSWQQSQSDVVGALQALVADGFPVSDVQRGSALDLPYPDEYFDAVITDPPYYDNVPYAYLADFFYVWLRRSVGSLYSEHFAALTSPVKAEAVMDPSRHGGKQQDAKEVYEDMMARAFTEARRVLKPGGPMVCVYAHKTTAGWATLVDALRKSGFEVTEAWPVDTENPSRQRSQESAALASSIFLVARRREGAGTGSYEDHVRPELERIVRERVKSLWDMGIAGADLVISAVGAGLRAFTRFARVEYANGDEVRPERFLAEVEGVVLETLLERIFGVPRAGVAAVDGPSRFYVLWRYAYGGATLDGGEAIVFTYSQPVELDGPDGLSSGSRSLVEKEKGRYRLRDYVERGSDEKLGLPDGDGDNLPLIDVLHRVLWLLDHEPRSLPEFFDEAKPNGEHLRLLAQALGGPGLKGPGSETHSAMTTPEEQAALGRLLSNWRSVVDRNVITARGTLFGPAPETTMEEA